MKTHAKPIIVVALDQSPTAEIVLDTTTAIAKAMPAVDLHLVHVVQPAPPAPGEGFFVPPMPGLIEQRRQFLVSAAATLVAKGLERPPIHVLAGDPAREIADFAAALEADLIVVGPFAKGLLERMLFGSVSKQLVARAPCAILVAHPEETASEVTIEPACPACQAAEASGTSARCAQHTKQRRAAHLHYEYPQAFARGSMFINADD